MEALKTASAISKGNVPIAGSTYGKMNGPNAKMTLATAATHISLVSSGWTMPGSPATSRPTIARRRGTSHGQIVMLPVRHLHPLTPQHGERPRDARPGGALDA